ncbi:MAG: N-6 DNA methylase, partial [Armatimonadetes bacterium]|nr:N-6 DNA methylase [Armatimonadota bacterium]
MLDGTRASLNLCTLADRFSEVHAEQLLSWSWSSDLRHTVALDPRRGQLSLRRWDDIKASMPRPFPRNMLAAQQLLEELEREADPASIRVIPHVLGLFRQIRSIVPANNALAAISLFNCMLLLTETTRDAPEQQEAFAACRTIQDIISLTQHLGLTTPEGLALVDDDLALEVGYIPQSFMAPEPRTGLQLDAGLLLRHAAGQLYQEAHLLIEREKRQPTLPGMGEAEAMPRGELPRDVRLTPTPLARTLAQEALKLVSLDNRDQITILDPACGSGVFLQEAIRELERVGYPGRVHLHGFDLSEIACAIAKFCLDRAVLEAKAAGMEASHEITQRNALHDEWGEPDVILMNPPFTAWDNMSVDDQQAVSRTLGDVRQGRPDKCMAFVSRAVSSLAGGGAASFVLPSAMLDNISARPWREQLSQRMNIELVGRFKGYGYFRASMVEPAFLVADVPATADDAYVRVLIAEMGAEERAMRALRLPPSAYGSRDYELFRVLRKQLTAQSWSVRSQFHQRLLSVVS